MSLLRNKHTNILVTGSALEIEHYRRLRTTPVAIERLQFVPSHTGPPWQAALDRFAEVLASTQPAAARVRLSGRFCRFALLPWSRGLTREEETALARALFIEIYGQTALSWEFRVDNLKRGEAMIACAVDSGLVTGIADLFASGRWRLDALEPLFAGALADRGETGKCWNALLETDWWSAVLTEGEAFLAVCNFPAQSAGFDALAAMLANENVRLAQESSALRILTGSSAASAGLNIPGWTVEHAEAAGGVHEKA